MVAPDNLNFQPKTHSARDVRVCSGLNLMRPMIVMRRKYCPWALPSSVVGAMTVCVTTSLAMLIGIVVVCSTIEKRPGMYYCDAPNTNM